MTAQQRRDTFVEEARPLTPSGHGDGSDDMVARRDLSRVGQKKKKNIARRRKMTMGTFEKINKEKKEIIRKKEIATIHTTFGNDQGTI